MLKQDLIHPDRVLIETHISWVFLGEREVWKVKKPIALGFLDFSSLDARHRACVAEVTLNARLAADTYLGVEPITRDPFGRHTIGGDGPVVDYAVHMRRLPDADRLDVRLSEGRLSRSMLDAVAERIARFHADGRADEAIARYGSIDAIRANVVENFEQTSSTAGRYLKPAQLREIQDTQLRFLDAHATHLTGRLDAGRIRDGHGDIRSEHVYISDAGDVQIIDCIEFNDRFRFADVCSDVAFLAMDLSWRGRVDLAERLLAVYARDAQDFDLYPLVDFYESYRAYVRAKVSSILAEQQEVEPALRAHAHEEARRYYLLALASERRTVLPPTVLAVGGFIASGKSAVSDQIADALGAPVVDADRTRKHLAGVTAGTPLHDPAWQGAYTPEMTARVYEELLRRARAVLESGRPVVLDASFRSAAHRRQAQGLARDFGVLFQFVECRAPIELCRARLADRAAGPSVSDGRAAVFDDFIAAWEPVCEFADGEHVRLDTSAPLEANIDTLRHHIPTWPRGLEG